MQQHLLVSLHHRPDPLLYKAQAEGTVLGTAPTTAPTAPGGAAPKARHNPAPSTAPPRCFPIGSEPPRLAPTFLQVPGDGADDVGRVALVLGHGALQGGGSVGLSTATQPRMGPPPHPSTATNLVPLDDVLQLAQQLGLNLLVQEDVGPGQAVVLGMKSKALSGMGADSGGGGSPGEGLEGEAPPYLHQGFLDGHEHLHVAIHPRGILEIETPPYWKKRATLMKATAPVSSSASRSLPGGGGGLNPPQGSVAGGGHPPAHSPAQAATYAQPSPGSHRAGATPSAPKEGIKALSPPRPDPTAPTPAPSHSQPPPVGCGGCSPSLVALELIGGCQDVAQGSPRLEIQEAFDL